MIHDKLLEDFSRYLTSIYLSNRTNRPLSPKVASDTIGRVKRVEFALKINVDNFFTSLKKFNSLCVMIKENNSIIKKQTTTRKYSYHNYTYSVRLYYKFYLYRKGRKIGVSNDSRYNKT